MTTRIYPYRVTKTDQRGDVLLIQTPDDGDMILTATNGIQMTGGPETVAYLCLFGGNQGDDGTPDAGGQWWGNATEQDQARKYRSRTQHLLATLPPTSENLKRIQAAVEYDLAGMVTQGAASAVVARTSIPAKATIGVEGVITSPTGETFPFTFRENWNALVEELSGVEVSTPIPQETGDYWVDELGRRYVDFYGNQFQFRSA